MKIRTFFFASLAVLALASGFVTAQPQPPPFQPTFGTGAPTLNVQNPKQLYFDTAASYAGYVFNPTLNAWEAYSGGAAGGCVIGGVANTNYLYNNAGACAGSSAFLFDGTIPVFTQFQFTGLTATHSTQDINDQKGTSLRWLGNTYNAINWELSAGTVASPVTANGGLLKISKTEQMSDAACNGSNVDSSCNSPLIVSVIGTVSDNMQPNAAEFIADGSSTGDCGGNNCNSSAIHAHGQVDGAGIFNAIGARFTAENDSTSLTPGQLDVLVLTAHNNRTIGDCTGFGGTGYGGCTGITIQNTGTSKINAAIHVPFGSAAMLEGIVFNQNTITNNTIDDYSSSTNSYLDQGTHTTAIALSGTGTNGILIGTGYTNAIAGVSGIGGFAIATDGLFSTGSAFYPRGTASKAAFTSQASGNASITANVAGTETEILRVTGTLSTFLTGGVVVGTPTGGNEGNGSLNATTLFQNGTQVPVAGTSGGTVCLANTSCTVSGQWTFGSGDLILSGAAQNDIATFSITGAVQDSGAPLNSKANLASPTFTGTVTIPALTMSGNIAMGTNNMNGVGSITGNGANQYKLAASGSSGTNPTLTPNQADTNTGIGGVSGHVALIAASTNEFDCVAAGCTAALLLTGSAGVTITGAAAQLNVSSNFNTAINTGTSTGTITIGNSSHTGLTTIANLATAAADNGTCNSAAGVLSTAGAAACTGISTARVKNHIKALSLGLSTVMAAKPVRYFYNKGTSDNGANPHYGFLAEDMQKIAPELVLHDKQGKPLSWRWFEWDIVLTKAVQHEEYQIRAQDAKIASLTKQLVALQKQVAYLDSNRKGTP